jgi:uncharacterized membrane protein YqiK
MVKANQGVEIAEKVADAQIKKATGEAQSVKLRAAAEAEQIRLTGEAEATKILAIGKSTAESYELQVKAMGKENFAGFKITEMIGTNKIKVMPDILIGGGEGGGGGAMEGLLGLKLMESMDFNKKSQIPDNKNNSSDKSID